MREKVILVCSECLSRNYSTTISKESKPREFKKFCKNCGKVTVHKVSK